MRGHYRFGLFAVGSLLIVCAAESMYFLRDLISSVYLRDLTRVGAFLILFGLLSAWGVSVRRRVMRDNLRVYLIAAAFVMLFWLVVLTARNNYVFAFYPLRDVLWYAYYIPIIILPLLSFFVARSVGLPPERRPRAQGLLLLPAVLLILTVMTNGLHHLVFRFVSGDPAPNGAYMDASGSYTYEAGYFAVAAWVLVLEFASILLIIVKSRGSVPRAKTLLPIFTFAVSVAYWLGYWRYPSRTGVGFIELPVGLSWCSVMIWESCIRIGLIPVNTRYKDFFYHSTLHLQVTDPAGVPYLSSVGARPIPRDTFNRLRRGGTVLLDPDTEAHLYPEKFGFSVWQEDVSALNDMIAELRLNAEELREGNTLAGRELAAQKKREKIREQTRLYSLISSSLREDFDGIRSELDRLDAQTDPALRRELLARINLRGVFLKRLGNAVMMAEGGERITEEELRLCFAEVRENAALCGTAFSFALSLRRDLPLPEIRRVYAFLRAAFSDTGPCPRLHLLLSDAGGGLRLNLTFYPEGSVEEAAGAALARLPGCRAELLPEEGAFTLSRRFGEEATA